MRFTSRPVSSPGRTENPPLLMRFLRTNVGSRSSRVRSRSRKPIFFRRKNNTTETTQEPSSPKVTCMGQVRIKRSKKPKPGASRVATRRRCGWFKNGFICHSFVGNMKPTCFNPVWRKWKSFSHVSFSRKSEKRSSSSRSEPIFSRSTVEPEETRGGGEEEEEEEERSDKSFVVTPPRNAFLLTRCRSAPYRSPSFANGFFEEEEEEEQERSEVKETSLRGHASPENVSTASVEEEEEDDKGRKSVASDEEVKRSVLGSSPRRQCRVLTRCKSEPSRLVPDMGYRQNQRLGFT